MAVKKSATKAKTAAKATKRPAAKPASGGSARAKGVKSGSLSLTSLSPSFTANDLERSLAWYRDVLGCEVMERWERDGKLMGVALSAGKAFIMLGQDDWKKGRDRIKGQGFRIYCETGEDIDRLAAKIKAQGGKLTQEPTDQPWGMRDICLEDPDGYKITIAVNLKKKR